MDRRFNGAVHEYRNNKQEDRRNYRHNNRRQQGVHHGYGYYQNQHQYNSSDAGYYSEHHERSANKGQQKLWDPDQSGMRNERKGVEKIDSNQPTSIKAKYVVKRREPEQLLSQQQQQEPSNYGANDVTADYEWPSLSLSAQQQLLARSAPARQQQQQRAGNADSPTRGAPAVVVKATPAKLPQSPLMVISSAGHFTDEGLGKWLDAGNTNFSVISTIGLHGCGKSTVLNALLANAAPSAIVEENQSRLFPVQNIQCLLDNSYKTDGLHMQVTENRTILLDCQPLLSLASAEPLIQAAASERRNQSQQQQQQDFITVETGATMRGLQLCSFLMSVSHTLLVVLDSWVDCELLRLMQIADMLRPAVIEETNFQPRLLFILNRCSGAKAAVKAARQAAAQLLAVYFESATFRLDANNIVCLPLLDGSNEATQVFNEELERLQRLIFATPRHHMLQQDLFNERVWFEFAGQVWDGVQKSVMLSEYHRLIG